MSTEAVSTHKPRGFSKRCCPYCGSREVLAVAPARSTAHDAIRPPANSCAALRDPPCCLFHKPRENPRTRQGLAALRPSGHAPLGARDSQRRPGPSIIDARRTRRGHRNHAIDPPELLSHFLRIRARKRDVTHREILSVGRSMEREPKQRGEQDRGELWSARTPSTGEFIHVTLSY